MKSFNPKFIITNHMTVGIRLRATNEGLVTVPRHEARVRPAWSITNPMVQEDADQ